MHYPQTGDHRLLGQAADRLAEQLHLPRGDALRRPAHARGHGRALPRPRPRPRHDDGRQLLHHPRPIASTPSSRRPRRGGCGRGRQDLHGPQHAPEGLRDTAQSAYDDSAALIARWHGQGRPPTPSRPASRPPRRRTSSRRSARSGPSIPDCLMQTHLSEQLTRSPGCAAFIPEARDYLDTYEALRPAGAERASSATRSTWTARERARLARAAPAWSIARPPTPSSARACSTWAGSRREGARSGWPPTPAAGPPSRCCARWPRPTRSASCAARALHPAQLLWLATAGSAARSLHLGGRIGSLRPGGGGRPRRARPRLHPRHRPAGGPGRGRLGGGLPDDHDGRRPGGGGGLRQRAAHGRLRAEGARRPRFAPPQVFPARRSRGTVCRS